MTLFQDNLSPYLTMVEQGSTPASPSAGNQKLFVRTSDHVLCYVNSSGTVTPVASGGGSGSITASGYTQSTARLLGRTTAATGAIEEITVGSGLSLSAGSLTATGGASFTSYSSLIAGMSGLVHRWKFEEASGNFADSVGSLPLTASGAFTYSVAGGPVSGASGSVTFGAAGKGTSSGLGSIPTGTGARTFVLVYKGSSTTSTSKQALFSYGTASTRAWWTAMLNDYSTNTNLSLDTYSDDAPSLTATASGSGGPQGLPALAAVWHLAAFIFDGASNGVVAHFLDGNWTGHILNGALATGSGGNFTIGQDTAGSNQLGAFTFDDLAVFSRALQPYEVSLLFAALAGQLA